MKAIMISIQPKWVKKILNREKTIEIRKTVPKCDLPCKVYVYCTNGNLLYDLSNCGIDDLEQRVKKGTTKRFSLIDRKSNDIIASTYTFVNRKIVAEFTLNKVEQYGYYISPLMNINNYFKVVDDEITNIKLDYENICLTEEELIAYADDGKILPKPVYAWHIDDLKIYDTPKELNEFYRQIDYNEFMKSTTTNVVCFNGITCVPLKIPPQSWCYVEEV